MDNITRYYWITWDNTNGIDGEEIFRTRKAADDFFSKLAVPYKKLVACYNDRDETITTVEVKELPSGYWASFLNGDWLDASQRTQHDAIALTLTW